jgi:hypothetical protein
MSHRDHGAGQLEAAKMEHQNIEYCGINTSNLCRNIKELLVICTKNTTQYKKQQELLN